MLQASDYKEKIFGVWDPDHCTSWDRWDMCDASPDGLSGKKEGFYFANWLMPLTIPFNIQGVSITPDNFPICIINGSFRCDTCTFFSPDTCPIFLDKHNIQLTIKGFKFYRKVIFAPKGNRFDLFRVTQNELLSHGKPLHYQYINKILASRYPTIGSTERKVHNILRINPVFFHDLGDGVYIAINDRKAKETSALDFSIGFLMDTFFDNPPE